MIQFDNHQNKFFLGRLIPAFWNWISKTFSMAAGSFLFCRKEDFDKIDGFPETMYAGEELQFVRKLKKLNRKSVRNSKYLIVHQSLLLQGSLVGMETGKSSYIYFFFSFSSGCTISQTMLVLVQAA